MAAEILTIADAVVTALNGHVFAAPYAALAAQRLYVPVYNLKDLATLQVTVVPRGRVGVIANRGRTQEMGYEIDVGFQKRTSQNLAADIDALMLLVESVSDFLVQNPLTVGNVVAGPMGVANDPIYDPKRLDEMQEFLSVLTVTWRTWR